MEALFDELWGRDSEEGIFEDYVLEVPQAQCGVRPGYKSSVEYSVNKLNSILKSLPVRRQKVKIVRVSSRVPVGHSVLLARDHYDIIREKLIIAEEERFSSNGIKKMHAKRDFEISGQPGSGMFGLYFGIAIGVPNSNIFNLKGKSFFLTYLLIKRLIKREPTVYRCNDSVCYLFDDEYKGKEVTVDILFNEAKVNNRRIWILTDGVLDDERWNILYHDWFVVLAASPAKLQASSQWEKDRNVGVCYMTNWTWSEIFAAFR